MGKLAGKNTLEPENSKILLCIQKKYSHTLALEFDFLHVTSYGEKGHFFQRILIFLQNICTTFTYRI